jgi:cytidine deaminase
MLDTENRQQSPIRIIMAGGGTATVVNSAKDLLPFTFRL